MLELKEQTELEDGEILKIALIASQKLSTKELERLVKCLSDRLILNSGIREKTAAGKTLAKNSAKLRTIKTAPKSGRISVLDIKHAVKSVSATHKKYIEK